MEALSTTSLPVFDTMASSSPLSPSSQPQHFLKMEDIHQPSSASPSSPTSPTFDDTTAASQISPPPVVIQSKPAKKRKSWGQELPEPKTNLPPRKRAKTDDEKEQRRIERIKRNRAAAHNSRERKRQETETLAVALARANAEIEAYRKLHGPLPSHIVLPEVHVSTDGDDTCVTTSVPVQVHTPAPSLVESHGSVADHASSPASPAETSVSHRSPHIKQESVDSPFLSLPPAFDNLDSNNVVRPAVSVQRPDEHKHQSDVTDRFLVEHSLSVSDIITSPELSPYSHVGALDTFAFSDGALDASFNAPLNFSFDDLIDDSATFAVDAQASGAV